MSNANLLCMEQTFMKNRLSFWLKWAVTIIGLGYVITQMDWQAIATIITDLNGWGVTAMLGLITASLGVRAYRWWLLLQGLGQSVALGALVRLYLVGNFFNSFLPTGFGGDVVRAVGVAREMPASLAAGTVLTDRLTGLMALFLLTLPALLFRPANFPNQQALLIAALCLLGLLGGSLLLDGRLIQQLGKWLPAKISPTGDNPIAHFLQAIKGCGTKAIWQALAVSMLFNGMLITWWAIAGWSLGYHLPLIQYILAVPILSISLLIPSIGGLGVREAIIPLLFVSAGLSHTQAVALSLLEFTVVRLSGIVGAPFYLFSPKTGTPKN